ncbi:MAG TPA: hypothetical protein VKI00_32335 [Mycobacterium sp.]|uniref:hypothetical protein n=1 Tax=Mycobacterium sp. TaxID=1785 RepID=UPI002C9E082A|nr:hypothetical protein [Mycobacterium sp.]HME80185.1 hypothetical protein [Mycobacterium sp.]
MVETDLTDYFQQMCKQAEWSLKNVQEVGQSTRSQPPTTKDKGPETADDRTRADTAQGKASGHWQELRDQWRAHVVKVREDAKKKTAELDAAGAAHYAAEAESNAQEAIGHALDAIDEAEHTVIYALRARAEANTLASNEASRP